MDPQIELVDDGTSGAFVIDNVEGGDPPRLAEMDFHWRDGVMVITHTGVRPQLRGRGIAGKLVHRAVARARAEGFAIRPVCPFAKAVFDKEPDLSDVRSG